MEPEIVKIKINQFGGIETAQKDIPEGLCQFERPLMTALINEKWIYYKNYGLVNFAFAFKRGGLVIYIGWDYAAGSGYLQGNDDTYLITNILKENMFRASREQLIEIFIAKGHPMSSWLLFNQDLWNPPEV
jgi:hypothetical protein